jgi:hypothetical protein
MVPKAHSSGFVIWCFFPFPWKLENKNYFPLNICIIIFLRKKEFLKISNKSFKILLRTLSKVSLNFLRKKLPTVIQQRVTVSQRQSVDSGQFPNWKPGFSGGSNNIQKKNFKNQNWIRRIVIDDLVKCHQKWNNISNRGKPIIPSYHYIVPVSNLGGVVPISFWNLIKKQSIIVFRKSLSKLFRQ